MRPTNVIGATLLVVLMGLALACTDEDTAGACDAIASACHAVGDGGGLPRECHDLGHAGDDVACAEKKDDCLAACPKGQATPATSDGGSDADVSSPDPECDAYCRCLAGACAAIDGYPFAAPGSCSAACSAQSPAERACYPRWCAKAESSRAKHDCEHAWGGAGVTECGTL